MGPSCSASVTRRSGVSLSLTSSGARTVRLGGGRGQQLLCAAKGGGLGTSGAMGTKRWSPGPCPPTGSSQVENIQPFSAKDLSIRSLGDRIRDLGQLRNLYPNTPKDQAFGSHYNSEWVGAEMGPGLHICLPSNAAARIFGGGWGWRGEGFGSHPGPAGPRACRGGQCWQRRLARRGPVLGCWFMGASPLRAEEQTGKDGRGYVSTAIKMTVESERWARVRGRGRAGDVCPPRGRAAPGQGLQSPHRAGRCVAAGRGDFWPGRMGMCLRARNPPWASRAAAEHVSERAGLSGSEHGLAHTPVGGRTLLPVLTGMMLFRRDQQPQSAAGGPPEAPQAQMFSLPVLQPELHPENLQSVLSPMW